MDQKKTHRTKNIKKRLERRELRNEFLNDFGKGFKNAVIVDRSQVKGEMNGIEASLGEFISEPLMNVSLCFCKAFKHRVTKFPSHSLIYQSCSHPRARQLCG
jgi:hypothetical protein